MVTLEPGTFEAAKRVHFVGIGGAGMSALASLLLRQGRLVSGTDMAASEVTERLKREGATVTIGHTADAVGEAEWVVYSDAIRSDNPELDHARVNGLPTWRRSQLLGWFIRQSQGIAITGTHGKTTTTAMVGLALETAALDPTVLIGGDVREWGGNARIGAGSLLVAEACEAYNSFLDLAPKVGVITNVEADHLDYHGSFEALVESFRQFVRRLPAEGTLVLNTHDATTPELASIAPCGVVTFGFEKADLVAENIRTDQHGSRFEVSRLGESLGEFSLAVTGRHMVLNALASIGAALAVGAPLEGVRQGLAGFTGVHRRMELIAEVDGVTVMDDYAHHPTEIEATLKAARERFPGRRLIAIFQPHLYSRTRDFLARFVETLSAADEVAVTDIYPAREAAIPGVSSSLIAEGLHALRPEMRVRYVPDRRKLADTLTPQLGSGDVVMTIGAGNVVEAAHDIAAALNRRVELQTRPLKVAVLMGGDSAEREISLSTGRMVMNALDPTRFEAYGVNPAAPTNDGGLKGLTEFVKGERPDVAFIALHGTHGEDGCIQGLLEILGIPYTGPGVLASAIAMNKQVAKQVLAQSGVDVPKGREVSDASQETVNALIGELGLPLIVKPNAQGSTIGVTRVYAVEELTTALEHALSYDRSALVEELVNGIEISTGVIGNRELQVLPHVEIVPTGGFYDFAAKYTVGATDEICPARLDEATTRRASGIAADAYRALGCRGFSRVDMIITGERIVTLEVNTVPGLTPTSLLPKAAEAAGIPFPQLLERILNLALEAR